MRVEGGVLDGGVGCCCYYVVGRWVFVRFDLLNDWWVVAVGVAVIVVDEYGGLNVGQVVARPVVVVAAVAAWNIEKVLS